jgi:sugar phosphate isomerase/epimerase
MIRSAVTLTLVPEMRGGPFIFSDDLAGTCQRAADLGFDAVELFYHEASAVNVAELQNLLTNHKLAISAFGTGAGRVKYKLSLTDPDARQRRRAINYITQFIDVAAQFNTPAIIGSMQGRWGEGGVRREQALAWLGEALNEVADRAAKHRLPVLYEFLNRYETNLLNNVEQALGFLRTLRTQNIKLLCDLFHMNIEEPDIAASIRYAGDKVGHVHFADTNRHVIGQGHLDMAPIADALDAINYSGFVSAEALPLPDSEAAARQTIASFQKFFPR